MKGFHSIIKLVKIICTTIINRSSNILTAKSESAVSFRNKIVNGDFSIDQRERARSLLEMEAGEYICDRWRAGALGCKVEILSTSHLGRTVLILKGSISQTVEGELYLQEGGNYTLSWNGTAKARVHYDYEFPQFRSGPIVIRNASARRNMTIEFGIGSISVVQLEPGIIHSSYESRDDELIRCQRYYQRGELFMPSSANNYVGGQIALPHIMRCAPRLTWSDGRGNINRIETATFGQNVELLAGGPTATAKRVRMDAVASADPGYWAYFEYELMAEV